MCASGGIYACIEYIDAMLCIILLNTISSIINNIIFCCAIRRDAVSCAGTYTDLSRQLFNDHQDHNVITTTTTTAATATATDSNYDNINGAAPAVMTEAGTQATAYKISCLVSIIYICI